MSLVMGTISAQQDLTLFFMHDLPQANMVNPAIASSCETYLAIPILGSTHFNYNNTAFSLKDAVSFDPNSDSLIINYDNLVGNLKNTELVNQEASVTLFSYGRWFNDIYGTFSISEKQDIHTLYNDHAANLFWNGNTPYRGEVYDLSGNRILLNHYREFAFGASKRVRQNLRLGLKAKLLFGMANIYTPNTKGSLYTDETTFALSGNAQGKVKASLPVDYAIDSLGHVSSVTLRNDINPIRYALNPRNLGVAMDMGFVYQLDEDIQISGSLLDVGAIFWRTDDATVLRTEGEMFYRGVSSENTFEGEGSLGVVVDSLMKIFGFTPEATSYTSFLNFNFYLGATYQWKENVKLGALFHSHIYHNRFRPSLTLSANANLVKNLSSSFSYTIQNGEFDNVGLGFGYRVGNFQFHVISDNLPGLLWWDATRNVNLRFGFALVFGCPEEFKMEKWERNQDPYDEYINLRARQKRQKRPRGNR